MVIGSGKKITLEQVKIIFPVAIASSIVTGFGYLFLYTTKHGIPFPLSLSSLPSLLIVVMAVAVFLGAIILCFMFLPVIAQSDRNTSCYYDLYEDKKFSLKNTKTYLEITGYCAFLPVLMIYLSVAFSFSSNYIIKYFLFPSFLYSLLSSSRYAWKLASDKKKETSGVVLLVNLLSCVWVSFLLLIILNNIPKGISDWWFWIGYPIGMIVFASINYLLVVPLFSVWESINTRSFIALCVMIVFFPLLVSPIGSFLTDKSMYILKLGGGYKAIFYLYKNASSSMPKIVMSNKNENSTKQVYVFLDIGDTKYVSLTNDKKKVIYGIKAKDIIAEIILQ